MSGAPAGRMANHSEPRVPELDATRFEMREVIGTGGMGTVYRAVQRSVGRDVAIKVLAPEHAANAAGLHRFVREANAIARLNHPNIVQLIDFGRDALGQMLLVMELLEGESLRTVLRREAPMAPERALAIAVQCLGALRAAHAAGIVHRDLKPENIFVQTLNGEDHVKVLDFGVAKSAGEAPGDYTTQGSLVGTLRYMAPEQIAGELPDGRIDLYALGVVLYELLAGTLPYESRDRFVLLRQIISEPPTDLRARLPGLSADLAAVVMKSIAKHAKDRYQSADEFRRALAPFLAGYDSASMDLAGLVVRTPTLPAAPHPANTLAPPIRPVGDYNSGVVSTSQVSRGPFGAPPQPQGSNPPRASVPSDLTRPDRPLPPSRPEDSELAPVPLPLPPRGAPGPAFPPQELPVTSGAAPTSEGGSRSSLWLAFGLVFGLLALGGLVGWAALLRRKPSPGAPTDPTRTVQTPTPPVPSQGSTLVVPPVPSTVMVVVSTRPPGAVIHDPEGAQLCPATPCAIPVPVGGQRSVRIQQGEAVLNAVLESGMPSVSLNLEGMAPPPEVADAGNAPIPRPATNRPRRPNRPDPGSEEELPMFLPHNGR